MGEGSVSVTSSLCLAAGYVTSCQPALTDYQPLHVPTTTKKPGAFPSPMPNEFGVCMVYGRCCTGCDGARQA